MVVNILDATNLERNLYLTTQLIDMDLKVDRIDVYNQNSKLVHSEKGIRKNIDLSHLPNATYVIRFYAEEKEFNYRIQINH